MLKSIVQIITFLVVLAGSFIKTTVAGFSGPLSDKASITGKGYGVLATASILRGECIIREVPLITIEKGVDKAAEVDQKVSSLSESELKLFSKLFCCEKYCDIDGNATPTGIFNSNALPLEEGSPFAGLFPTIARFNHDCTPNAHYSYDGRKACGTLFASRDIDEGDEIAISYIPPFMSRARRQEYLSEHFEFSCACKCCDLARTDISAADISDRRREGLRFLGGDTFQSLRVNDSGRAIELVQKRLKLLKDEQLDTPEFQLKCSFDAYQALYPTNQKVAREWLVQSRDYAVLSEGGDSDNAAYFTELLQQHDNNAV